MDIEKMLTELREDLVNIEEAIVALERLAEGRGKRRRGRPAAWLAARRSATLGKTGRRSKRIEPPPNSPRE
jgi:hypothetical protein